MKLSSSQFLIFCYCITLTTLAFAEPSSDESNFDVNNGNDHNDYVEPNYPGEVRNTSDGKKVKLWSTKGPVPVSQASEPFNTQQTIPPGTFINVDGIGQGVVRSQIHNQHKKSTNSSRLK